MMKPFNGTKHRRQRGDMLLEALIGVLLLGLLGLGLTYAASRVLVQQRYANTQDVVLRQMRSTLETQGVAALCAAGSVPLQVATGEQPVNLTPTVACSNHAVTVIAPPGLPAIDAPINTVVTEMRFATPENDAQAAQLLGEGSLVIRQ